MNRVWITRLLRLTVLGGALVVMSGCPLWNRFARDIGVPEWQVDYRPPIREGATNVSAGAEETLPASADGSPMTAALTDEEITATEPGEDLGRAPALDGSSLPLLSLRTLENGLKVEALRVGEGAVCEADSKVVIACRGELLDGRIFDETQPGQPYGPWRVEQLIVGMQQGIVGMNVGGIRRLTIPPSLAYGNRGVPGRIAAEPLIPANSTLIYTVELLDIGGDAEPAQETISPPDEPN